MLYSKMFDVIKIRPKRIINVDDKMIGEIKGKKLMKFTYYLLYELYTILLYLLNTFSINLLFNYSKNVYTYLLCGSKFLEGGQPCPCLPHLYFALKLLYLRSQFF